MSEFRFIRYLEDYDVARQVLSRPPLNIMTIEVMREMAEALDRAASRTALTALNASARRARRCCGSPGVRSPRRPACRSTRASVPWRISAATT